MIFVRRLGLLRMKIILSLSAVKEITLELPGFYCPKIADSTIGCPEPRCKQTKHRGRRFSRFSQSGLAPSSACCLPFPRHPPSAIFFSPHRPSPHFPSLFSSWKSTAIHCALLRRQVGSFFSTPSASCHPTRRRVSCRDVSTRHRNSPTLVISLHKLSHHVCQPGQVPG